MLLSDVTLSSTAVSVPLPSVTQQETFSQKRNLSHGAPLLNLRAPEHSGSSVALKLVLHQASEFQLACHSLARLATQFRTPFWASPYHIPRMMVKSGPLPKDKSNSDLPPSDTAADCKKRERDMGYSGLRAARQPQCLVLQVGSSDL